MSYQEQSTSDIPFHHCTEQIHTSYKVRGERKVTLNLRKTQGKHQDLNYTKIPCIYTLTPIPYVSRTEESK